MIPTEKNWTGLTQTEIEKMKGLCSNLIKNSQEKISTLEKMIKVLRMEEIRRSENGNKPPLKHWIDTKIKIHLWQRCLLDKGHDGFCISLKEYELYVSQMEKANDPEQK